MRRLLPLALIPLLAAPAAADEGAWYDPAAVVKASRTFAAVAGTSQSAFAPLESALKRTDRALADLDLSVALTAGVIDGTQTDLWKARLDRRSGVFGDEFGAIQERLTERSVAFEALFDEALQRAVGQLEPTLGPLRECAPKASLLSGPSSMGGRAATCVGADASARIASAWDQDAELASALQALQEETWPPVSTYDEPAAPAPLGAAAGPAWIHPATLAYLVPEANELLDAVDAQAERRRGALRDRKAALDRSQPDLQEQLIAIRDEARGLRAWADKRKAEVGAALWASVDRGRKKAGRKGGWSDAAACLNSEAWGACPGADVTSAVSEALLADKKLLKELDRLRGALSAP